MAGMTNETTAPVEGLLPCPAGHGVVDFSLDDEFDAYVARCMECNWKTWGRTEAGAIDAWNTRAEQPRPTEAGGWRNPAPDAAAPAVTTGYHFVMSTADLRPTEAPTSLHKPQTSPDATPGKAMADGLAGEYAVLVTFGGKVGSALIQPEMSLRILAALTTDGVAAEREACERCGGTGDVHNIVGEWLGVCPCPAGDPIRARVGEG